MDTFNFNLINLKRVKSFVDIGCGNGRHLKSLSSKLYNCNLIGIDHVGIGGDWDGVEVLPKNLEHIGKLPTLTKVLIDRGYTKKEIRKILGENFKRVFKEVL